MSEICIVPVNAIDTGLLNRLALCLEERFLAGVYVRPPMLVPKSALNSVRKQLFFGSLATRLTAFNDPNDAIVLGVTDIDLYKTSHQFVFGSSSESHRCAAISVHRLRGEFYGDPADENLLFQRMLKESVHELGHAMGLKHCYNSRCPMYYSISVFDTDNKFSNFCEACEKRSRANR
jgi:archaemetzincin